MGSARRHPDARFKGFSSPTSGDRFGTPEIAEAATSKCQGVAVGEGEMAGEAVDSGADVAPGDAVGTGEATADGETCVVPGEGETAAAAVGAGDACVLANSRRSALWLVLLWA
jgi:hypothetical protein